MDPDTGGVGSFDWDMITSTVPFPDLAGGLDEVGLGPSPPLDDEASWPFEDVAEHDWILLGLLL